MKESFKMTVACMLILISFIWVIYLYNAVTKSDIVTNTPDTTIKKYVDEEANMMCYYTDTWGSCFYVLKD